MWNSASVVVLLMSILCFQNISNKSILFVDKLDSSDATSNHSTANFDTGVAKQNDEDDKTSAVYEGDIIMTDEDLKKFKASMLKPKVRSSLSNKLNAEEMGRFYEGDIVLGKALRNGRFGNNYRWPKGIIPYEIKGQFSTNEISLLRQAMDTYHKFTCIRFRPKHAHDRNYITIGSENLGCYSHVGNQRTGSQEVNLAAPDCVTKVGTAIHELMHVTGFWHEQSRHERDDYVDVHFENIKPGREGNFNKTINDINFGVPYDYQSVMHYSPKAFSSNGKETISPKCPSRPEDWQAIARQFKNRWQFVNCGGALDGKHIRIVRPPRSGAMFYNYKGFYSVVLMALVSADYKFMWLDIGKQGRISDAGILDWTGFYQNLKSNKLNFPPKEDNDFNLDFVLIGDEAFALDKHLLKPYANRELTYEKQIFNYRLSRARNVVENAFGLLTSRFRIFHTPIAITNVESINYIVAAACTLHNFLLSASCFYSTQSTFDRINTTTWTIEEGEWRRDNFAELIPLQHGNQRNSTAEAKLTRDTYCDFFNGLGKVAWQDNMLAKGKA